MSGRRPWGLFVSLVAGAGYYYARTKAGPVDSSNSRSSSSKSKAAAFRRVQGRALEWQGHRRSSAPQPSSAAYYEPSPFEEAWVNASGRIRTIAASQVRDAKEWTAYTSVAFPSGRPVEPPAPARQHLSRFSGGPGARFGEFIEPLTGVGRHPLFDPWSQTPQSQLFDIDYLIPANACGSALPKPRTLLFDLGCTVFGDINAHSASGAGPSIPLFYNMYKARCLEPDEIFAWEGLPMRPDAWWRPVPLHLRHKVHFYNFFVEELDLESSVSGKGDPPASSFLGMLPFAAKEDDFVVIKLDIDGGPEMEIAFGIANRPDLAALVDEIYFEYHYYYDGADFGWGKSVVPGGTVDTALGLMKRLRALGIRSHFWI